MVIEMEWFATQWVFVQPARMRASHGKWVFMQPARMRASWNGSSCSLLHHRMRASWYGASKYSILGRVHRRYWREIIQFNASEFGEEFGGSGHRRYWREIIQFNASEFGEEFGGSGHHLSAQRYNTLSNRRYS
jgi:hypothetical protein